MARARAARAEQPVSIKAVEAKVLQKYVSLVSRMPFVEQVLVDPGYEGVEIWTVIDSEPFSDGPSDQIYGAELEAALSQPQALGIFRPVNRLEYGDEKLTQILPARAHVAWRHGSQS